MFKKQDFVAEGKECNALKKLDSVTETTFAISIRSDQNKTATEPRKDFVMVHRQGTDGNFACRLIKKQKVRPGAVVVTYDEDFAVSLRVLFFPFERE
ncbi:unnamed protein product, partial [Iphiclides podalirius]